MLAPSLSAIALMILQSQNSAEAPPSSQSAPNPRCGSYCVYVCLRGLGFSLGSFEELDKRIGNPSQAGYSMLQLEETAESYGANTLAVETTLEHLRRRKPPFACIVLMKKGHYVVLSEADGDEVHLIDPPEEYSVPADTFRALWTGQTLLLSSSPLDLDRSRSLIPQLVAIASGGVLVFFVVFIWWKKRVARHASTKPTSRKM